MPWQAGLEGRRHAARGGVRKRAAGARARHQLLFVDRLVATLIHLRHGLPHSVPGLLFSVDRSTTTGAVGYTGSLNLLYEYIDQSRVEGGRSPSLPRRLSRVPLSGPTGLTETHRQFVDDLAACLPPR
ncbi:transposase family protein [Streptomyces sp. DH37]|nr:transposase family protein [Streptomyces sp. DH37]MDG9702903.1 transposase family protein [Streptomyces sp. DH37]